MVCGIFEFDCHCHLSFIRQLAIRTALTKAGLTEFAGGVRFERKILRIRTIEVAGELPREVLDVDEDDEDEDAGAVTEPKTYFPCTQFRFGLRE